MTGPSSGSSGQPAAAGGRIGIEPAVVAALVAHARAEAPRECCGLLIGTADRVDGAVPATNLEPGTTRYLIDPAEHFAVLRSVRGSGRDVVGAYHSHPRSPAVPSASDVAEAGGEAFLYVIVSLAAAGDPDVRAYRIREGTPHELTIDPG